LREKKRDSEREGEEGRKREDSGGRFIAKIQVYLHPSSQAIKNRKLSSGYWSISKQRTGCAGLATGSNDGINHHRRNRHPLRKRRENAGQHAISRKQTRFAESTRENRKRREEERKEKNRKENEDKEIQTWSAGRWASRHRELSLICTTLIFIPAYVLDGALEVEGCRGNDSSASSAMQDLTHIEFIRACIYNVAYIRPFTRELLKQFKNDL